VGQGMARLRRGAERDGVDRDIAGQQVRQGREVGRAVQLGIAADDGGQLETRIGGDGWKVLVAGDLAKTNESKADRRHSDFTVTGVSAACARTLRTG